MSDDGFFTPQEVALQRKVPERARGNKTASSSFRGKKLDCETCGLYRTVLSPKMEVHGRGERNALAWAEGPGETEDKEDDQLVGEAGDVLREGLKSVGLDLDRDFRKINSVNCRPTDDDGDNRAPTAKEIACCREVKIKPALAEYKPKFIVLMGNHALDSFWGERHKDLKIGKFRGRVFPDRETGAWVMPIFHPSFILRNSRNKSDKSLMALWRRDLQQVADVINDWGPPEFRNPEDFIECITDYDRLIEVLDRIQEWAERIVFDYETSGLKPFRPGHKIHSISVVPYIDGEKRISYSFPFQYPGAWSDKQLAEIQKRWVKILTTHRIKKIAHNLQFEDMWSRGILDVLVDGWTWCTMNNVHILDNTRGTTGLKWQAWQRYGVEGYDEEFAKYREGVLTPEERKAGKTHVSNHHFNRVHEMPLNKLLLYGGYDGILESWLYDDELEEFQKSKGLNNARSFFHQGLMVLCDQQEEGVPIDEEYYKEEATRLDKQMSVIGQKMLKSPEAKLFVQKEGRQINTTSNDDLKKLLFKHLGKTPAKLTDKLNPSVDAEVLKALGLEFTDNLLEWKHLDKIRNTYIEQITREAVGGKVFPSTGFHTTATYRPSINGPNFANLPKRDKAAKLSVRRGIRVPRGYKMGEPDYSGIEVHGLGWYSEDPELLRYLHDPTTDMHRDQAQNILDLPPKLWNKLDKDAVKTLRAWIKNQWVFPQFYGSYYKNCARKIWQYCADLPIGDSDGTTVKQHLGMGYPRFEEKLRDYEQRFWSQFEGVRDWQNSVASEYQKYGYIETKMGFRYGGWMTRNNLYNYKIQGTAFHLLLWSMIQLHGRSVERDWRTYVMWQIYDAMPMAIWPAEQKEVLESVHEIMVDQAKEKFTWINTPIKEEMEITKVDGTYADLVEFDEVRDRYEDDEDEEVEDWKNRTM